MFDIIKITAASILIIITSCGGEGGSGNNTARADTLEPVYVVIMNHVEGDTGFPEGDSV